jgi:class 3 adenylate cyclase
MGIATGLVVVGDLIGSGEAQERGIVGETPNLAARLQGIAEPNTVVDRADEVVRERPTERRSDLRHLACRAKRSSRARSEAWSVDEIATVVTGPLTV